MKKNKTTALLTFSLALALMLSGCVASPPSASSPLPASSPEVSSPVESTPAAPLIELADNQVLIIGHHLQGLGNADPTSAAGHAALTVVDATMSHLVRFMPGTTNAKEPEADLAESWTINADMTSYTFKLREGVQWTKDFGEFTSEDVKHTLERLCDPSTGSQAVGELANLTEILCPDKYTVIVNFSQPEAGFLTTMCNAKSCIESKAAREQYGDNYQEHLVGTGAFILTEHIPNEKVYLTRNDDYFRGKPILEGVEIRFIPDATVRLAAFLSGEVNMSIANTNRDEWYKAVTGAGHIMDFIQSGATGYLAVDVTIAPFDDVRVRQAMAYACDMQLLADVDRGSMPDGCIRPALAGLVNSPGSSGYTLDQPSYPYNPEKAKQLLAEAGYADGFAFQTICSAAANWLDPFTFVQDQLKKVGIIQEIETIDNATFQAMALRNEIKPAVPSSIAAQPDSYRTLSRYFLPEGDKFETCNYNNPELIELLRASTTEGDPVKRDKLLQEVSIILATDLPLIPAGTCVDQTYVRSNKIEIGYEMQESLIGFYPLNEKISILK